MQVIVLKLPKYRVKLPIQREKNQRRIREPEEENIVVM